MIYWLPEPRSLQPVSLGRVHQRYAPDLRIRKRVMNERFAGRLPGEPCSVSSVLWTLLRPAVKRGIGQAAANLTGGAHGVPQSLS